MIFEENEQLEVVIPNIKEVSPDDQDDFAKELDVDVKSALDSNVKKRLTRMEKRFAGANGAQSQQIEEHYITAYNAFEVVLPPYNMAYLAKLYELSSAHMSAVDAKVGNIVGLGYDFIDTDKTEERIEIAGKARTKKIRRTIEKIKRSLREQLDGFNEDDGFLETLIKVVTDQETTGNGFLEIGRGVNGKIGYIGHIPAQTVRVRRDRDGFVQMIGNRAVFFRNFGDRKTPNPLNSGIEPNEIIHFKIYSPTNNYYGIPKIVSAKVAVAGNEFAGKYNLDYFENKAVPRYVVVTKGAALSKRSQDQLFQFFSSNLKGVNHRTLYLPLPADNDQRKVEFEMQPVEAGIQDASFNNYRKSNLADILMAHRVPLAKVNTAENISLAAARDADKTFKEQVTRPAQSILEKKLNKIMAELTDVVKLKLNELALSDENTQSQIDERNIRNKILVPNEVRARMGMPGYEGGDEPVELKPQQAADAKANTGKTRDRDSARSAGRTDSAGEGRSAKGDGRTVKAIEVHAIESESFDILDDLDELVD
jgi:PBSX family phage portal protein